MSRLKGADLGVVVPGAALNYRGAWTASPSPAYATNDLVTRNGVPYVANLAPGATDPLVNTLAVVAGITPTTATGYTNRRSAQPFQVSAPTVVSQLKLRCGNTVSFTGGLTAGIASSIAGGTATYLASGLTHAVGSNATDTVTLNATVTLVPGVTYYLVCEEVNLNSGTTPTYAGTIVVSSDQQISTGPGVAFTAGSANYKSHFELDGPPWSAIGITSPLNYRGVWSASPSPAYAANDLVVRNSVAYFAEVTPGSVDPATGPINEASITPTASKTGVAARSAQPFQVSVATPVDLIKLWAANNGIWAAGQVVGIATAITGGTATYLTQGVSPTPGITDPASGGTPVPISVPPVILQPGTQYWLVSEATASECGQTSTTAGNISSSADLLYDASFGSTLAGYRLHFELDASPWRPLTPILEPVLGPSTSGGAFTLPDVGVATMHRVTLNLNTTITLPAPGPGKSLTVLLRQDGTGGRTVAWATPSGAVRWPGGTAPVITAAANAIDVVSFSCIDGVNWFGFVAGQAFA